VRGLSFQTSGFKPWVPHTPGLRVLFLLVVRARFQPCRKANNRDRLQPLRVSFLFLRRWGLQFTLSFEGFPTQAQPKTGLQLVLTKEGPLKKAFSQFKLPRRGAPYAGFAYRLFLPSGHGFNRAARVKKKSASAAEGLALLFRGSDLQVQHYAPPPHCHSERSDPAFFFRPFFGRRVAQRGIRFCRCPALYADSARGLLPPPKSLIQAPFVGSTYHLHSSSLTVVLTHATEFVLA